MLLLPSHIETGTRLVVTSDHAGSGSALSVLKGQRVRAMCAPGSAASGAVVARLSDDEWGVVPLANLALDDGAAGDDAAVQEGEQIAMRAVHAHADDQVDLQVGERCCLVSGHDGRPEWTLVRRLSDGAQGFVPADALQAVASVSDALAAMSLAALNRNASITRSQLSD